jgi:outer membrane protein
MKKIKLFIAALFLFVGATSFMNAQEIAHINSQDLIAAMPEMKAAQSQLEKLQKTYDTEIKNMMKEFENKYKQYEAEATNKTEEENAKRAQEIQNMQNNISAYRDQAIKDLQKKEADLLQPVLDKAKQAIQKVARAQGFKYVLDSGQGSGVIMADGKDLLNDVKKDLGI